MLYFQNLRLRYKKLLIIILPILILLLVMVFLSYNSIIDSFGTNSITSKEKQYDIESMNYHLRSNATDYQVEIFNELKDAVNNNDEQKIVEGVAKNFIADVYTWTNKEDKWDVGGMSYVYSKYRTITYYQLRDTLYQLMAKAKRNFDKEEQIQVTNVNIISFKKNDELFEIENKKYESYNVECSIQYSGHGNIWGQMTTMQYLTIIKDTDEGGRFEIAVSYGD